VCAKADVSITIEECSQFQLISFLRCSRELRKQPRLAPGINPYSPAPLLCICHGHEEHHLVACQGKLGTFSKDLRPYDGTLVSLGFRVLWIQSLWHTIPLGLFLIYFQSPESFCQSANLSPPHLLIIRCILPSHCMISTLLPMSSMSFPSPSCSGCTKF
jgi:hypothetical protein